MDLEALASSPVGVLVPISGYDPRFREHLSYQAFLPHDLPDRVELRGETYQAVIDATVAVARLDQAATGLPNPMLLARPTTRREAVSTSALEGTYAALSDVLEADLAEDEEQSGAISEVLNYVRAAERAYEWVKSRPITLTLLCEFHKILVRGTRGDGPEAGELRTIQVFIGLHTGRVEEARFVPPPPGDQLEAGLAAWVRWINEADLAVVLKMALGHYQFETLHPFNDGNGRLGRLVCVLQLLASGELSVPLLDLSGWLEQRRREYQDHLLRVSVTGEFDPWVQFFSEAVRAQATAAIRRVDALLQWQHDAVQRVREAGVRGVATRIVEDLIGYPVLTPTLAAKLYGVTYPTANAAIARLEELGLLSERTGRRYRRLYVAPEVLRLLDS